MMMNVTLKYANVAEKFTEEILEYDV